jgi:hypothetical protein
MYHRSYHFKGAGDSQHKKLQLGEGNNLIDFMANPAEAHPNNRSWFA